MRYSDDIIEEVRMKNDIVDVISQYVRLTRRGSSYFGLCPFHNEKTPSFSVTPSKQMYYCFGCGAGGNVYAILELFIWRSTFPSGRACRCGTSQDRIFQGGKGESGEARSLA